MDYQLVVFKGGTAFNSLLEAFKVHFPKTSYVVPISDDGGSSREICRVFGGPSIGDLRSTLTRLSDVSSDETLAVRKLLEYRLSCKCPERAMEEWYQLLEDRHPLYAQISSQYRGLVRCFLCKFEAERLQRISCRFDLKNGSIGNFFFTGARLVLGSLETAVFVYSSVARISHATRVLPIIDTMDRLHITACLKDGSEIVGQDAISHPSVDGVVVKDSSPPLEAPIDKLFYINKYGNPFSPILNRSVLEDLKQAEGIIYGIGSLWTSIIASLVLDGVGTTIAEKRVPKILLLNSCLDRETDALTANDFIQSIAAALNGFGKTHFRVSDFVSHLVVVEGGSIALEEEKIAKLNVKICKVPRDPKFDLYAFSMRHAAYSSPHLIDTLRTILAT